MRMRRVHFASGERSAERARNQSSLWRDVTQRHRQRVASPKKHSDARGRAGGRSMGGRAIGSPDSSNKRNPREGAYGDGGGVTNRRSTGFESWRISSRRSLRMRKPTPTSKNATTNDRSDLQCEDHGRSPNASLEISTSAIRRSVVNVLFLREQGDTHLGSTRVALRARSWRSPIRPRQCRDHRDWSLRESFLRGTRANLRERASRSALDTKRYRRTCRSRFERTAERVALDYWPRC